jgi:hypothetical protein
MNTRINSLAVLLTLAVSVATGQTKSANTTVVFRDTVKIFGPNGANDHNAPPALQVFGGQGGAGVNNNPGNGGGIAFTAGGGGSGLPFGATGGGIVLKGGAGGDSSQGAGEGGSIKLIAGTAGSSSEDNNAGGSIILQAGEGTCSGVVGPCPPGNIILELPQTTSGRAKVGVGTSFPSNTLEVVAGGTTLADAWTTRSSRRFKTNIQPLLGALEKVEQLQGVSYQRRVDGQREIGVVAEDVDLVVPEVVSHDPNTNEVQGVDYARLAALLIEAVKSQQAELRELKARVEQLTANSIKQ